MPHVRRRTLGFLSALAVAGLASTQSGALAAPQTAVGGLAVQPGSMAARSDRHALIIGIGQYADPRVPSLAGIAHDMESARKMARALGVSERQTTVLQDADATKHGVLRAIAELSERVRPGDRVFIYYSGHGTRWAQTSAADAACVEALLAFDRGTITNAELATALSLK